MIWKLFGFSVRLTWFVLCWRSPSLTNIIVAYKVHFKMNLISFDLKEFEIQSDSMKFNYSFHYRHFLLFFSFAWDSKNSDEHFCSVEHKKIRRYHWKLNFPSESGVFIDDLNVYNNISSIDTSTRISLKVKQWYTLNKLNRVRLLAAADQIHSK